MLKSLMNFFSDFYADVRDGVTDLFTNEPADGQPGSVNSTGEGPSQDWQAAGPSINLDGTPMLGDSGVDVMGKPYGFTDNFHSSDDWMNMSSDIHGPICNVDGTPMMGDSGVDIHGNPFGVTDSFTSDNSWANSNCTDSFGSVDTFSSCNSFNSFDSFSSCDSFSSFDSSW